MKARIYIPSQSAATSGKAKNSTWVLEFDKELAPKSYSVMNWTSQADMNQQIKLKFNTSDEAVAYAEKYGIAYAVKKPKKSKVKPKSYASNFTS